MYTKMDGTRWNLIDEDAENKVVATIYSDESMWIFGTRSYHDKEKVEQFRKFIANGYPQPKYKVTFYHEPMEHLGSPIDRAERIQRHYELDLGYHDVKVELEYPKGV